MPQKNVNFSLKNTGLCYYEQLNGKAVNITEEIPFDLPGIWEWCRTKNIIELLSGRDLTPQDYNDTGGG